MRMRKAIALAVAAMALASAGSITISSVAFAQNAAQTAFVADEQTTAIVEAADAFLASLSEEQRAAALFDFNDATQRANWSNFPLGIYDRAGVPWGDLSEDQRALLTTLLGTVLSEDGLVMVQEQMAADDVLAGQTTTGALLGATPIAEIATTATTTTGAAGAGRPAGGGGVGGPGGGGGLTFGSDYYYVSFLGEPSATSAWTLQFGGHHLAINATVAGADVTLAPSLTGGQPTRFTLDGEAVYIVEDEVTEAAALLASLTAEQLTQAVLSTQSIDLVLGPGKDGITVQPEGIPGSAMTDAQKTQLLALIESRLGILNADDLAPKMADAAANIDQTYFAWYGSTTDTGAAYWRVTGPTVVLEFSPQSMGGDSANHLHNMTRDPANDYGAAWTALN